MRESHEANGPADLEPNMSAMSLVAAGAIDSSVAKDGRLLATTNLLVARTRYHQKAANADHGRQTKPVVREDGLLLVVPRLSELRRYRKS